MVGNHQTSGFEETQVLLVLQGCHRRDHFELAMKGRGTHVSSMGQIFDVEGFAKAIAKGSFSSP
jgi:hypothetical protein